MKANVWLSPLTHVCLVLACGALAAEREADYGVSQGLIGYWTFDEIVGGAFTDSAKGGLDGFIEGGVSVEKGVLAAAVQLEGRPVIRIKANEVFSNLSAITISAWVKPKELANYREILLQARLTVRRCESIWTVCRSAHSKNLDGSSRGVVRMHLLDRWEDGANSFRDQ